MITRLQKTPALHRQSGAALIVGLILMLVLTVLGVSGMTVSVFGLTMASNAQFNFETFQAAETGIDFTIDNANLNTVAAQNFTPAYTDGTYTANTQMTCQIRTQYLHSSFSIGEDEGSVQAIHYDVVATAAGPDGAQSINTQSFYVAGPPAPGNAC
jgi:type IV pilus assembly protein PilX